MAPRTSPSLSGLKVVGAGLALLAAACGDTNGVPGGDAGGDVGDAGTGAADGSADRGAGETSAPPSKPGTFVLTDASAAPTAPTTPTEAKNCGVKKHEPQRLPPELLLVLDKSGSMREAPNGRPGVLVRRDEGKWAHVTAAINTVVQQTQAQVAWGLKLFPSNDSCAVAPGVQAEIAPNNFMLLSRTIAETRPRGGTPTQAAVRGATLHLRGRTTPNPKVMVLATDGLPGCAPGGGGLQGTDPVGSAAAVADAAAAGFPVYVIGIATAGTIAHATLNDLAVKGGRPRADMTTRYFPVANQAELAGALTAITGQIATCTFTLDSPPPDPANVAVEAAGQRLAKDPTHANGWDYKGPGAIEIFGPACEAVKAGPAKTVQILYGCPGVVIE